MRPIDLVARTLTGAGFLLMVFGLVLCAPEFALANGVKCTGGNACEVDANKDCKEDAAGCGNQNRCACDDSLGDCECIR